MVKLKLSLICLFFYSSFVYAEYDRAWLQLGSGFGTFNVQAKVENENSGWAYEAAAYYHEDFLLDSTVDRDNGEELKTMFKVLAVSKLWSAPFSWGYADVGIGLGIGQGSWKDNCSRLDDGGFFKTDECDVKEGTRIGIPLQASAVIGKYVGLGISFNAFIPQDRTHAGFLITVPLGKFTR
jgi:hypothetical protein